jgi:hypothetical protein
MASEAASSPLLTVNVRMASGKAFSVSAAHTNTIVEVCGWVLLLLQCEGR